MYVIEIPINNLMNGKKSNKIVIQEEMQLHWLRNAAACESHG